MAVAAMSEHLPVFEHRAALPWCYYDKKRNKIVLRLLCSADAETAVLLWGDPYDWYHSDKNIRQWRFTETVLYRQFAGINRNTWKVEIDIPPFKRLKYGFKIKTSSGEYYFSENGIELYSAEVVSRSHNHFSFPFVHEVDAPQRPEWVEQTVWYQIFPDRFCRKDYSDAVLPTHIENWETGKPAWNNFFGGNLPGIREKLPWLAGLGITGLYLTPVFKSPSNHKYNIEDYFAVDPHFGDINELKALVAEAHSLSMRVMLDAVFNHAGDTHPFWLDVLKNQEKSPYKDYFHVRRFPVRAPGSSFSNCDLDYHAFAWTPRMPKWNTENPDARKYLLDAAAYWIRECDIDGWRLDVANEVSVDFWKDFSRLAHSLKDDFYILGEIWHDSSPWLNLGLFDSVMNYPLGFAVSDFFVKKETCPESFTGRLFIVLTRYSDLHNRLCFNLLDSHDTDRVLSCAKGDKIAVKNAFTMLFLLPGTPCIYYGTEVGMGGAGDPECRRPMLWDENQQDGELRRFFQDLIAFRSKFLPVISNSMLSYYSEDNIHYWKFSGSGEALTAVYAETTAARIEIPGTCVFGPKPVLEQCGNGELPPGILVVYYSQLA
jgi:glycosidase